MNNKIFIILLCFLAAIAIACNLPDRFAKAPEAQMADFPRKIGNWESKDVPISEQDYAILGTRNLFIRDYTDSQKGSNVNLYIIYSASKRRALHPPEICYTGGGATITKKIVAELNGKFKVNLFTIQRKNYRQIVAYWFKSGNLNTYSYLKEQIKFVFDHLRGKKATGAMIRVSAEIKNNDPDKALKDIESFMDQIMPLINKYVP